jgi:hypothetical protein
MGGAVSIPADCGLPEDTQASLKALHADEGEDAAKAAYADAMAAKNYFLVIDADGDGSIDSSELKSVLKAVGKAAQMKTNSGMQVLELMKMLSGGQEGEVPITMAQWIAGLGQESSAGLRDALKTAYDPESKRIAGLLTIQENVGAVDAEIASLEAQLAKLKEKRAKMARLLKAGAEVSPAEAAVAAAAADFVAEGC